MIRVFIADSQNTERLALRLLLMDFLDMEVVGEAANWSNTLAQVPICTDMVLVDWNLLPSPANGALKSLRMLCPDELIIVLINQLDAYEQAALSSDVDAFISKGEMSNRVAGFLSAAAASIPPDREAGLEVPVFSSSAIVGD